MTDLYERPSRERIAARVRAAEADPGPAGEPQGTAAPPQGGDARVMTRFGARVAAGRRARGWETSEAASRALISAMHWARIENGTAKVTLALAAQVAVLLHISLDDLLAPCAQCGDAPPAGFTCNACGTAGASKELSRQ